MWVFNWAPLVAGSLLLGTTRIGSTVVGVGVWAHEETVGGEMGSGQWAAAAAAAVREVIQGGETREDLESKWGFEYGYSGISTFAHLPHVKCLTHPDEKFDIGIIGAPFDTAVSYRPDGIIFAKVYVEMSSQSRELLSSPVVSCLTIYEANATEGARFGPRAIRAASARQTSFRGFNARAGFNPYTSWAKILDCGDIPITPMDNALALVQMTSAFTTLGYHRSTHTSLYPGVGPKLITLGGDHSLALPALRAVNAIHGGPVAVLHFDAHLDTWHPAKYPSFWESKQSEFNHGSMFWMASNEGLILNGSSVHAGLRTRLSGWDDYDDDDRQGFMRISADDIDDLGTAGVISAIMDRIGSTTKVYLSIDIDVLDPGLAPGTGTPEPGGWTSRELIRILRGIEDLNVVGADVVEVAPAYDGTGEQTALAGAQVVYEVLTSIVKRGLADMAKTRRGEKDEL
ncbi:MAG: hypothetical protein M1818_003759 [Claussenomyces sp. TS43310]|nr:MAG: hypothetical protein M1818_003759 [Claussenomyces sp. TS43310]